MVEIQLQIEGVKSVSEGLDRLRQGISAAVVPATLQAAEAFQKAMQQRAPVRTGRLRDSILSEITDQTANRVEVEIGPTVDYADDVEFGGFRRMGNPFMRSAIDENEDAVVDAIAQKLQDLLDGL
jgi:HK97 gp10 family phage protein